MCAARQLPPSWGNETTASPMQCELGLISDDQHDARNVSDSNLPRPQSLEPISGRPPTYLGACSSSSCTNFRKHWSRRERSLRTSLASNAPNCSGGSGGEVISGGMAHHKTGGWHTLKWQYGEPKVEGRHRPKTPTTPTKTSPHDSY